MDILPQQGFISFGYKLFKPNIKKNIHICPFSYQLGKVLINFRGHLWSVFLVAISGIYSYAFRIHLWSILLSFDSYLTHLLSIIQEKH